MVSDSRRAELLEAAARILAEEGPKALSTRRLATEVGTSTMAVYTWFGGKPELIRQLFREGFRRLGTRLRRVKVTDDPVRDLGNMARAYRQHALANPHLFEVMFGRGLEQFSPDEGDLDLSIGTLRVLEQTVARCVEAGRLRCDPQLGARQLWGAVHGLVSLELASLRAPGQGWTETYEALMTTMAVGLGDDRERAEGSLRRS